MAELLKDVDALARRFEACDKTLADRIAQATRDGASQALGVSRLNFQSALEEQGQKLIAAGRRAAADVGVEINVRTAELISAAIALDRKALRLLLLLSGFALLAGAAGGGIVFWLVGA